MSLVPYSGFGFWLVLLSFVSAHSFLKVETPTAWLRNAFMILVSTLVLFLAQYNPEAKLLLLFAVSILVFYTGKALQQNAAADYRKKLSFAAIAVVIAILCYFKYSKVQTFLDAAAAKLFPLSEQASQGRQEMIFFLGVSYFSFKFIHFLIDCYKSKIKNPDLLTFINYILFFPSFFGGPINRYQTFSDCIANPPSTSYLYGSKRIINGLFKKIVLANSLLPFTIASLNLSDPSVSALTAVIGVYAYMLYIYFDFSGYTDMAIGSAEMVGIKLPENFNYPFFKRNLQQFWANWHMSLTAWLTDYIYWPLARKFRHVKNLKRKPITISNIAIVTTFMACGLWHGDGMNFFIWGTYHGIGLAILNVYGYLIKRYASRGYKAFVSESPVAYGISTFVTVQYVAFGFLLFGCDLPKIKAFFDLFV